MRCAPFVALLTALSTAAPAAAAPPAKSAAPASFAEHTRSFVRRDGLLATWLDPKTGRLMVELPRATGARGECARLLHLEGIRTGLGSNPVGLDRGQLGETRLVVFRRVGGRVLLEQENLRYRAGSSDSLERRSVRESFASSVLWSGGILAERPDGTLLVDLTSFVVRDAHGVVAALKNAGQGAFTLDGERSTLDPAECRSFPDNLEFEAVLTFTAAEPGSEVRATAPAPQAVTLIQHQSLVRLPDDGYVPRAWDPRAGAFDVRFADYAQPIGADLDVRRVVRHRLEKTDPAAARSTVKRPIVYYVDPGAPEPIRSALIEGASWWARAFEAAGFVDAFQVKLLPPDVHPLDVRYNVIQWVHRATRGWSYGWGVIDPRTGEMLKGHVTLGSLRVRQDRMIFEGLAGTGRTGSGAPDDPVVLSLARIRQLAAHEVGHTLGLAHNFAASTYGDRASVMDYPAPRIGIRPDGSFDFSAAYGVGVGVWDVQAVRHAYSQFSPGADERAGLEAILRENRERGYRYLNDDDARPPDAGHPMAAMWDDGDDPVAGLAHAMEVRRLALARFGERNLLPGSPASALSEVLVPLWFHHRYAVEAAAKCVGGLEYSHAVVGDGTPPMRPVPAARQREAVRAVLATLDPAALDVPEPLLARLAPRPLDEPARRESFDARTRPAFDALGAAGSAADLSLATLLPAGRLARLVDFHRRDPELPGVDEVLDAIVERVFAANAPASERQREILRTVQATTVRRLLVAAADPGHTPAVRAALEGTLRELASTLGRGSRAGPRDRTLHAMLARDITRYLDRGATVAPVGPWAPPTAPEPPPGPPIGAGIADDDCNWTGSGR